MSILGVGGKEAYVQEAMILLGIPNDAMRQRLERVLVKKLCSADIELLNRVAHRKGA